MKTSTPLRLLLALPLFALIAACDVEPGTAVVANAQGVVSPAPGPTVVRLGQPGRAGSVQLTVTDITTPTRLTSGTGLTTEPGETFVVVSFKLKNVGDAPLLDNDRPAITLRDAQGRAYEPDGSATRSVAIWGMADPSGYSADLNPNVSAKTKLAWKLDKAAFDLGTWHLSVASAPRVAFALR